MNPNPKPLVGERAKQILRVLHLEDNLHDRELVGRVLMDTGIECELVYAANKDEFQVALNCERFDLILSDFTMPGYDGASALALAQAQHPEVPYLIVSGTIGEERAIDSLKNGATDYVLKNRLERLWPAVQRALREAGERAKRRSAEEALRRSEERFREMAETIRDIFWITSPDGRQLVYVSPAYEEIFGRPIAGLHARPEQWIDAIVPEDRAPVAEVRAALSRGAEYRIEYQIKRPDGTTRWLEDRGYPVAVPAGNGAHVVGIVSDITDRKQLQAQLLQAQKMEAIGQLAGGIAHDFNNILTVINGSASMMLDAGHLAPADVKAVKQIYTAGERAARLTRQLLVFSRKQEIHREPLDLNRTIEEVAKMIGRLIGENISLSLELAPQLPAIRGDAVMVEQVLMNLAVNARDAMPRGGQLTIATQRVRFDETEAASHVARRAGDFVRLSVRDAGCGIAPAILPRIFEPFFTTKDVGVGTGLGLATVFGIVEHHEGWIEVESQVGEGTCFNLFLPPTSEPVAPKHRSAHPFPQRRGNETVLLVEDEAAVREFAVAVLENSGYRVLQAGSGVQALEVWKWHQSRIALLLTDLVMPDGITGVDLAKTLRSEKPDLTVVFTSGYSRLMSTQVMAAEHEIPFIQKPYVPATLTRVVREALDQAVAAASPPS
ncbi:MAG: multi-sensor hybrid histidine kinase [Verrucomicrobia bacterium]|nr:multi-sensor hybrid histidine kinase [Verrucomicrobiota bacterium]